MKKEDVQTTAYALLAFGQLYLFGKFVWTRLMESVENRKFVKALRTNHIPHMERALRAICKKLDLEYEISEGLDGRDKTSNGSTDRSDQSN